MGLNFLKGLTPQFLFLMRVTREHKICEKKKNIRDPDGRVFEPALPRRALRNELEGNRVRPTCHKSVCRTLPVALSTHCCLHQLAQ